MKRAVQLEEMAALKADIDAGLADVATGRVQDFDAARIIERGRTLLAARSLLRLTTAAEADLAETWSYVAAEAGESTATRLIGTIRAACEPLCQFPLSRPSRDQLAPGLRVTFEGRYAIYYVHDEREVVIVRVLHDARDAATLATRGGFSGSGVT